MTNTVVAIDIGGTWTRVAAVDGISVTSVTRFPTRATSATRFLDSLDAAVDAALTMTSATRIGVSVTGPVDPISGTLFTPPNTDSFLAGLQLKEHLGRTGGLRVRVDRDTNCALLAEARYGSAAGVTNAVFATFSTGVGAAVLLNGELLRGRDGVAGELGHAVIDPAGPACGCGRRGCLESIASGPAIARAAGCPDGATATVRAAAGDQRALSVLHRAADALASACVDWANAFNPEVIVIGGSVARAHPEWVVAASTTVRRQALSPTACPVLASALDDHVSLIGAALLDGLD